MREDIDIRLLDYYYSYISNLNNPVNDSDRHEKAESDPNETEEKSSPDSSDKH